MNALGRGGHPHPRSPRVRVLAATTAVGLMLVPSSPAGADSPAPASNPNIYALSAEAVGIDAVVTDPSIPLNTTVDVGGFGASASLNSLGQSMADAGAPYSPYLFSLPGTVDGLAPSQIPYIPEPAGYVTSSYPTSTDNTQAQGPYAISAQSQPSTSQGSVRIGVQQAATNDSTVQATARTVANPDGSVSVKASTGVDLLNVGGLLDIGNITSTESITEQGSAPPTVTGSTTLGTVSLLGQPSGILGGALDIFGTGVPVPLSTTLLPLLNQVLAAAGISVEYVPSSYTYTDGSTSTGRADPSKTIQAVDSAGLKVKVKQDVKSQGLVTFTLTVGRVYVSALDTASPAIDPAAGSGSTGTSPSGTSSSASIGSTSPASETAGSLTDASGTSSAGSMTPSLAASPSTGEPAGGSGSAALGSGPSGSSTPGSPTQLERVTLAGISGSSFYLVLLLVALVLVGAAQIVRLLGVRHRASG